VEFDWPNGHGKARGVHRHSKRRDITNKATAAVLVAHENVVLTILEDVGSTSRQAGFYRFRAVAPFPVRTVYLERWDEGRGYAENDWGLIEGGFLDASNPTEESFI